MTSLVTVPKQTGEHSVLQLLHSTPCENHMHWITCTHVPDKQHYCEGLDHNALPSTRLEVISTGRHYIAKVLCSTSGGWSVIRAIHDTTLRTHSADVLISSGCRHSWLTSITCAPCTAAHSRKVPFMLWSHTTPPELTAACAPVLRQPHCHSRAGGGAGRPLLLLLPGGAALH